MSRLGAYSLPGMPEIEPGHDLAQTIVELARASETAGGLHSGQVLAIAHKAVSKSEGALVDLRTVSPTARARELADQAAAASDDPRAAHERLTAQATDRPKDPRAVQVVLDQSVEVLRAERGVIVCRTRHGFVCANAGVDASNAGAPDTVVVLPADPDASARRVRARVRELAGVEVGVLITDSFGRAWRHGQCDVTIGCAGIQPLDDWRGRTDSEGRELRATWLALADAIAATAELVRAKDSREPVVIVEGLERFLTREDGPGAAALVRPTEEDLFR